MFDPCSISSAQSLVVVVVVVVYDYDFIVVVVVYDYDFIVVVVVVYDYDFIVANEKSGSQFLIGYGWLQSINIFTPFSSHECQGRMLICDFETSISDLGLCGFEIPIMRPSLSLFVRQTYRHCRCSPASYLKPDTLSGRVHLMLVVRHMARILLYN